jgi:hypothetical protein
MRARLLVLIFLTLPLRAALAASTLLVPQDFPTIQAAVDAAADGDTILVKGGVYAEQVELYALVGVTLRAAGKVVIDAGGGLGLDLAQCSGCFVEGFRVQGADTGIRVADCSATTLSKCRVEGSLARGIFIDYASDIVVRDAVVLEAGEDAIVVYGDGCVVTGCRIVASGSEGVQVMEGTGTVVSGNRILDAGGTGIFGGAGAAGLVVSNNRVSDPSNGGIALAGDGCVLLGNVCKRAVDDGYQLTGNDSTALGNRALDNTEAGFILVGNGHLLSGNTGKGNGTLDLEVQGAGNLVDASNDFQTTGP